jgi:hypothetical protein
MSAADEIQRLEREIDQRGAGQSVQVPAVSPRLPGKPAKQSHHMDLILGVATMLAVAGFAVHTLRQMPEQQLKTLGDGLIGAAAGLLVGYGVGRFRP